MTAIIHVGYEPIDQDHEEFLSLLDKLKNASNADFQTLFEELHTHTQKHFEREKQLMQQSAFPAETEHNGEHQRVLGEFKQFKTRVDKGLITFGRAFVTERLPSWFQLHVSTMDSALAAHLKSSKS